MTPDHFETIVDGSRAPLSAAYAHNPLNPKTVTVFLDVLRGIAARPAVHPAGCVSGSSPPDVPADDLRAV
jgi:hypothetical protein